MEYTIIEVIAADTAAAEATVQTLPMARWFNLELYPTFDAMSFRPSSAG